MTPVAMRFFISRRLPGGFRAGISIPVGAQPQRRTEAIRAVSPGQAGAAFCYVIRSADGLVKVGTTTNLKTRLRTLQTASPYPLEIVHVVAVTDGGAFALEQETHRLLSRNRCFGEWFDVTPDHAYAAIEAAALTVSGKPITDLTKPAGDTGRLTDKSRQRKVGRAAGTFALTMLATVAIGFVVMLVAIALKP